MCSWFAAAHLHGATKPILCCPGSGFARWEQAVLTTVVFTGAGGAQPAPQHVPCLGRILGGRVIHDPCRIGAQRRLKNGFFKIVFDFLVQALTLQFQALTLGTADQTPRRKPCPQKCHPGAELSPGPCAYSHGLCGQGCLQPLACCSRVPCLLPLSPRSDL